MYKTETKQLKYIIFGEEILINARDIAIRLNQFFVNSVEDIVGIIPDINPNYQMNNRDCNSYLEELN